jgi:hypothetical protein
MRPQKSSSGLASWQLDDDDSDDSDDDDYDDDNHHIPY